MKLMRYFSRTRYWQIYAFENPPEGYKSKRAINLPLQKVGLDDAFFSHTKFILPFQRCDIFHTYNSIVTGTTPWIIEVETTVPRYGSRNENDKLFQWGIKKLRSDTCGAIIFTSEYTKGLNQENFNRWGIDSDKCHVVYRAVKPQEPSPYKDKQDEFLILFVGNGFYRKGGYELVKAFKEFNKKDARLIIISTFEVDWGITPLEEHKQFVIEEVNNNDQIEVHENLPHSEVIDWMKKSTVFVNTTYADTFNNAILEALSCNLPVIVSDVRAIPEFVEDGYNGYTVTPDEKDRGKMINHIVENLERYYTDSRLLSSHSNNAKEVIESNFLLKHRNKKLRKIYDDILE